MSSFFYNHLGERVFFSEDQIRTIPLNSHQYLENQRNARFLYLTDSDESAWLCACITQIQTQYPAHSLFQWYKIFTENESSSFKQTHLESFLLNVYFAFIQTHQATLTGCTDTSDFIQLYKTWHQCQYHKAFHKQFLFHVPLSHAGNPLMIALMRLYALEKRISNITLPSPVNVLYDLPLHISSSHSNPIWPETLQSGLRSFQTQEPSSFIFDFWNHCHISQELPETLQADDSLTPFFQSSFLDWKLPANLNELMARFSVFFIDDNRSDRVPYQSLSNTPSDSVQSAAMAKAHQQLTHHMDVMQFSHFYDGELQNYRRFLSAEQIDAIYLACQAFSKGKNFILADEPGMGKGRILASLVTLFVQRNVPVLFITEKRNLFTDFWRDINAVNDNAPATSPFILHKKGKIFNAQGHLLFKSSPKEYNEVLKTHQCPSPLVLTTYTQFNTALATNPRGPFIQSFLKNGLLILDESHNAAGESVTGKNIQKFIKLAKYTVFSSATFATKSTSMTLYESALPLPKDQIQILKNCLDSDPNNSVHAQLSYALCEKGLLVRREHYIETPIPSQLISLNDEDTILYKTMMDTFSLFVQTLFDFAQYTHQYRQRIGLDIDEFLWLKMGGLLSRLSRQIHLLCKLNTTADFAFAQIQLNRKPVIALESTFESFLSESLQNTEDDEDEPAIYLQDIFIQIQKQLEIPVDSNFTLEPLYYDHIQKIQKIIQQFPLMIASPFDYLRHKLTSLGITNSEISGRNFTLIQTEGRYQLQSRNSDDREIVIQSFNNGSLDCLLLSKAGSTGISLHSSTQFLDQRPRAFIELEIIPNPMQRAQFLGRVRRKNQIHEPYYFYVSTQSPFERRIFERSLLKLKSMHSLNASSHQISIGDFCLTTSYLSEYGDQIAYLFLSLNLSLAKRLGIFVPKSWLDIEGLSELLFKRICLLSHDEQSRVLSFYEKSFDIQESYLLQYHKPSSFFAKKLLVSHQSILGSNPQQAEMVSNFNLPVSYKTYITPPFLENKTQQQSTYQTLKNSKYKFDDFFKHYESFHKFALNHLQPLKKYFISPLQSSLFNKAVSFFSSLQPFHLVQFFNPVTKQHSNAVLIHLAIPQPNELAYFSLYAITLFDLSTRTCFQMSLYAFLVQYQQSLLSDKVSKDQVLNGVSIPTFFTTLQGHCILTPWLAQQWKTTDISTIPHRMKPLEQFLFCNLPTPSHLLIPIPQAKMAITLLGQSISLYNSRTISESTIAIGRHPKGYALTIDPNHYTGFIDYYLSRLLLDAPYQNNYMIKIIPLKNLGKVLAHLYQQNILFFCEPKFKSSIEQLFPPV